MSMCLLHNKYELSIFRTSIDFLKVDTGPNITLIKVKLTKIINLLLKRNEKPMSESFNGKCNYFAVGIWKRRIDPQPLVKNIDGILKFVMLVVYWSLVRHD